MKTAIECLDEIQESLDDHFPDGRPGLRNSVKHHGDIIRDSANDAIDIIDRQNRALRLLYCNSKALVDEWGKHFEDHVLDDEIVKLEQTLRQITDILNGTDKGESDGN